MMRLNIKYLFILLVSLGLMALTGCVHQIDSGSSSSQGENKNQSEKSESQKNDLKQGTGTNGKQSNSNIGKKELTIGTPNWPGSKVKSRVVANILEDMGYKVSVNQLAPGIAYKSLANEEIDIMLAGWLPTTHKKFWDNVGKDLKIAGINVMTTWLGLAIPDYVDKDIKSIKDLSSGDVANKFDSTITGIDPEAGVMKNTRKAMKKYGLKEYGWELESSSAAGMMSSFNGAVKDEKPIIITAWEPHAMFNITDLRKLKDSKNIYNAPSATKEFLEKHNIKYKNEKVSSDVIASLVYSGFKKDASAAYNFLNNFKVKSSTQSSWIFSVQEEDMSPKKVAEQFIKSNQEKVNNWKN